MQTRRESFWARNRLAASLLAAGLCHAVVLLCTTEHRPSPHTSVPKFVELDLVFLENLESKTLSQDVPPPQAGALTDAGNAQSRNNAPLSFARSAAERKARSHSPVSPAHTPASQQIAANLPAPTSSHTPSLQQATATDSREEAKRQDPLSGSPGKVNLFLNQSTLAELIRRPPSKTPLKKTPSVGLLSEGIAAEENQRRAASHPAIRAGRRAARLAPNQGTALFEIRTNQSGVVTSIAFAGKPQGKSWEAVLQDLRNLLQNKRFILPEGSQGTVIRVRVDRGRKARKSTDPLLPRISAIGEEHHVKDYAWDESSQARGAPGRMSPTLGISSEWFDKAVRTRVRLMSQIFL